MITKKTIWTLVFFLFFSIATASAVPMNDTIINLTSSHSTVTITYPWTFDRITVGSSWFYVENLTSSNPLQTGTTEKLTFNFTEPNKHYAGTDFPYVSVSSSSQKLITSNLAAPVTVTGTFDVAECNVAFNYESSLAAYKSTSGFSCDATILDATTIFTTQKGINTLNIVTVGGGSSGGISHHKSDPVSRNMTKKADTATEQPSESQSENPPTDTEEAPGIINTVISKIKEMFGSDDKTGSQPKSGSNEKANDKSSGNKTSWFPYINFGMAGKYAFIGLIAMAGIAILWFTWKAIVKIIYNTVKIIGTMTFQVGKVLVPIAGNGLFTGFKMLTMNIIGWLLLAGLFIAGIVYILFKFVF